MSKYSLTITFQTLEELSDFIIKKSLDGPSCFFGYKQPLMDLHSSPRPGSSSTQKKISDLIPQITGKILEKLVSVPRNSNLNPNDQNSSKPTDQINVQVNSSTSTSTDSSGKTPTPSKMRSSKLSDQIDLNKTNSTKPTDQIKAQINSTTSTSTDSSGKTPMLSKQPD